MLNSVSHFHQSFDMCGARSMDSVLCCRDDSRESVLRCAAILLLEEFISDSTTHIPSTPRDVHSINPSIIIIQSSSFNHHLTIIIPHHSIPRYLPPYIYLHSTHISCDCTRRYSPSFASCVVMAVGGAKTASLTPQITQPSLGPCRCSPCSSVRFRFH